MPLVVNGEEIPDALVQEEFGQIKSYYERTTQVSCCDRDEEFLEKARENLIGRALVTQEALRVVPPIAEPDLDLAIRELKKRHGGERQFYASMGLGPKDHAFVRENVDTELRIDRYVRSHTPESEPSEEDLRQVYAQRIAEFQTEKQVRASHIFKSFRSDLSREELFQKACEIRARLHAGEDFQELARTFSDKPEEEIDLGWYKRGELMDEFEYVTFSMELNEVSPVFASHHGFHIGKVTGLRPQETQPFEEVRDTVVEMWRDERKNAALESVVAKLKETAVIEVKEDSETAWA